jgi:hypothetical protein
LLEPGRVAYRRSRALRMAPHRARFQRPDRAWPARLPATTMRSSAVSEGELPSRRVRHFRRSSTSRACICALRSTSAAPPTVLRRDDAEFVCGVHPRLLLAVAGSKESVIETRP